MFTPGLALNYAVCTRVYMHMALCMYNAGVSRAPGAAGVINNLKLAVRKLVNT